MPDDPKGGYRSAALLCISYITNHGPIGGAPKCRSGAEAAHPPAFGLATVPTMADVEACRVA